MTTVVNIRNNKCDVYCGRPSLYSNPFEIGRDGTREDVIEKYREWFYKKLKDSIFRAMILPLKDKVLGCWCHPKKCHCDIIINYLDNEQR